MPVSLEPRRQTSEQRSAAQLAELQTAERRWAYALLRLVLGVDLFGHGAGRISHGVLNFASGIVARMSSALLPVGLVHPFAMAIPWIELTLGFLLIFGLLTRAALTAAMLFMIVLMIGVTIRQDWTTAALQLVYAFVIFALMFLRQPYETSWSRLFGGGRSPAASSAPLP